MNTLIFCQLHYNLSESCYALVPSHLLEQYDLNAINNKSENNPDKEIGDQISMIFDRLGLCPFTPYGEDLLSKDFVSEKDLEKYLDPKPPFRVDRIVNIIAD
jgi:hypothetical protein